MLNLDKIKTTDSVWSSDHISAKIVGSLTLVSIAPNKISFINELEGRFGELEVGHLIGRNDIESGTS